MSNFFEESTLRAWEAVPHQCKSPYTDLYAAAAARCGWGVSILSKSQSRILVHPPGVEPFEIRKHNCSVLYHPLSVSRMRDKRKTNNFLMKNSVPVPRCVFVRRGRDFRAHSSALRYPVVAKPICGTKGHGVKVLLQDVDSVVEAIDSIARPFDFVGKKREAKPQHVQVQEFITGKDYRVLLLNGEVCDIARRIPASVFGDGRRTTAQLIHVANRKRKSCRMPQIVPDSDLGPFNDIPAKNFRRFVQRKANVSLGGVAVKIPLHTVHNKTMKMFKRLASLFPKHCCIGADFIGDVRKPVLPTTNLDCKWGGALDRSSMPGCIIELNGTSQIFCHSVRGGGIEFDILKMILQAAAKRQPPLGPGGAQKRLSQNDMSRRSNKRKRKKRSVQNDKAKAVAEAAMKALTEEIDGEKKVKKTKKKVGMIVQKANVIIETKAEKSEYNQISNTSNQLLLPSKMKKSLHDKMTIATQKNETVACSEIAKSTLENIKTNTQSQKIRANVRFKEKTNTERKRREDRPIPKHPEKRKVVTRGFVKPSGRPKTNHDVRKQQRKKINRPSSAYAVLTNKSNNVQENRNKAERASELLRGALSAGQNASRFSKISLAKRWKDVISVMKNTPLTSAIIGKTAESETDEDLGGEINSANDLNKSSKKQKRYNENSIRRAFAIGKYWKSAVAQRKRVRAIRKFRSEISDIVCASRGDKIDVASLVLFDGEEKQSLTKTLVAGGPKDQKKRLVEHKFDDNQKRKKHIPVGNVAQTAFLSTSSTVSAASLNPIDLRKRTLHFVRGAVELILKGASIQIGEASRINEVPQTARRKKDKKRVDSISKEKSTAFTLVLGSALLPDKSFKTPKKGSNGTTIMNDTSVLRCFGIGETQQLPIENPQRHKLERKNEKNLSRKFEKEVDVEKTQRQKREALLCDILRGKVEESETSPHRTAFHKNSLSAIITLSLCFTKDTQKDMNENFKQTKEDISKRQSKRIHVATAAMFFREYQTGGGYLWEISSVGECFEQLSECNSAIVFADEESPNLLTSDPLETLSVMRAALFRSVQLIAQLRGCNAILVSASVRDNGWEWILKQPPTLSMVNTIMFNGRTDHEEYYGSYAKLSKSNDERGRNSTDEESDHGFERSGRKHCLNGSNSSKQHNGVLSNTFGNGNDRNSLLLKSLRSLLPNDSQKWLQPFDLIDFPIKKLLPFYRKITSPNEAFRDLMYPKVSQMSLDNHAEAFPSIIHGFGRLQHQFQGCPLNPMPRNIWKEKLQESESNMKKSIADADNIQGIVHTWYLLRHGVGGGAPSVPPAWWRQFRDWRWQIPKHKQSSTDAISEEVLGENLQKKNGTKSIIEKVKKPTKGIKEAISEELITETSQKSSKAISVIEKVEENGTKASVISENSGYQNKRKKLISSISTAECYIDKNKINKMYINNDLRFDFADKEKNATFTLESTENTLKGPIVYDTKKISIVNGNLNLQTTIKDMMNEETNSKPTRLPHIPLPPGFDLLSESSLNIDTKMTLSGKVARENCEPHKTNEKKLVENIQSLTVNQLKEPYFDRKVAFNDDVGKRPVGCAVNFAKSKIQISEEKHGYGFVEPSVLGKSMNASRILSKQISLSLHNTKKRNQKPAPVASATPSHGSSRDARIQKFKELRRKQLLEANKLRKRRVASYSSESYK
eukprot:g2913.t1